METKKVAVYILGGIGNQLYVLATLLSFAKKHGYKPIFDDRYIGNIHTKDMDPNQPPTKTVFDLYPEINQYIKKEHLDDGFVTYQEDEAKYQEIPVLGNQMLLRGYFQHPLYFEHEYIREVFSKWLEDEPSDDIVIHVRTGKDYFNNGHIYNILSPDYFIKALDHFPKGNVTIVSEDLDWCRDNIGSRIYNRTIKYQNKSIVEDMKTLVNAKIGTIIANSTFSWWTAFLSTKNIKVIFPKIWWNPSFTKHMDKQYYIDNWIPFDVYEGIFQMSKQDTFRISSNHSEGYSYSKQFEDKLKLNNNELLNYYNNMIIFTWYLNKKEECKEYALKIYQLWEKHHPPINKTVRQNVRFPLDNDYDINIDLTKIPVIVIALPEHIERKKEIRGLLNKHGITPIFSDGVRGLPTVLMNIGQAHINAMKLGLSINDKFLILEEDFELTEHFKTRLVLPPMTDVFYLGHSIAGLLDYCINGCYNGLRNIKVEEDIMGYYRIRNTLSTHGMLYCNKKYTKEMIRLMELLKRINVPCDIATAHMQEFGNVLSSNNPWCYQKDAPNKPTMRSQTDITLI